jgi:uncharacterized membrane protein
MGTAPASKPALGARLSDTGVLTIAILVIALVGTVEASYLTYIHYHGLASLPCFGKSSGHSSCEAVQSSVYSKLAGIPVALLGLLGYITILVTLFIRGEIGRLGGFGVALIGFGFSMYLTYRELFTLKEICEWCVASACLMTALLVLTSIRYLRAA